jgi:hypothetical protein
MTRIVAPEATATVEIEKGRPVVVVSLACASLVEADRVFDELVAGLARGRVGLDVIQPRKPRP